MLWKENEEGDVNERRGTIFKKVIRKGLTEKSVFEASVCTLREQASPVGPGAHSFPRSWLLGSEVVACLSTVVCENFNEILYIIRKSLEALEVVSLERENYSLLFPP